MDDEVLYLALVARHDEDWSPIANPMGLWWVKIGTGEVEKMSEAEFAALQWIQQQLGTP